MVMACSNLMRTVGRRCCIAKMNRTIDNTDLSSRNIMQTTGNDGVKDWWSTHSKSFRHSVFVLILTHVSASPFANWPAPFTN